jgi:hypothetical protein
VDAWRARPGKGPSLVSCGSTADANLDAAQADGAAARGPGDQLAAAGLQQPANQQVRHHQPALCWLSLSSDGLDEKQLNDLRPRARSRSSARLPACASGRRSSGGKHARDPGEGDRDALRARGLGILDVVERFAART